MTATQGNFIDETTALADGTYKIDGQLTEIAYKFKFNENSVECKFYEPGKEDSVEYTTFNLDAKDSSNSGSQTDDYTVIDTSTGTENSYTEVHKKGTGRQFKMTIEEFIEKHNQMVQDKGYAEKEEQAALRLEYRQSVVGNLRQQLNNVEFVEPDGKKTRPCHNKKKK